MALSERIGVHGRGCQVARHDVGRARGIRTGRLLELLLSLLDRDVIGDRRAVECTSGGAQDIASRGWSLGVRCGHGFCVSLVVDPVQKRAIDVFLVRRI